MLNIKYRIETDNDPIDPRKDCDHAGKMVCFHRGYNLGDEQHKDVEEFLFDLALYNTYDRNGYDAERPPIDQMIKRIEKDHVILPLYLYDHSGITMRTSPFGCRFDSGQVGFIYISRKDGQKEWGRYWRKKAHACLEAEVKEYDQYLTGEVYGYVVYKEVEDEDGEMIEEELDSCWGFYGYDYCEQEAKSMVEYYGKEELV